MRPEGRTIRQAINDGTAYQLEFLGATGQWCGEYFPPACESPEEVIDCFKKRFKVPLNASYACIVRHLHKSDPVGGCSMVEDVDGYESIMERLCNR